MQTTTNDFNLTSGQPKTDDMGHTKADLYQDPSYNVSPHSPAHASEVPPPVGQTDSMCDQVPTSVGQTDSMASSPHPSHENETPDQA